MILDILQSHHKKIPEGLFPSLHTIKEFLLQDQQVIFFSAKEGASGMIGTGRCSYPESRISGYNAKPDLEITDWSQIYSLLIDSSARDLKTNYRHHSRFCKNIAHPGGML